VNNENHLSERKPSAPSTAPANIKDSPDVIALPPVLYLGTLFLGLLIHIFRPLQVSPTLWIRVAGAVIFVSGVLLARWGRRSMVKAGTNVIPNKPTLAIVTDGPFQYTRNPLYVGATLVYTGLALIFNSFWPFVLLPPLLVVMHWGVVRREESYLESKFGKPYLDYKERVRRWI
jgi:protein-S-isoprenylcysteine O-methyltransferase Ste14